MKRAAKCLLVLGIGFLVRPTFFTPLSADTAGTCLYSCQGSTCSNFANTSSMCMKLRADCEHKCSQPGAYHNWGVIAYSVKDKGYGWSYGAGDLDKAKQIAMNNCAKNGTGCKVWVWYDNQCGAIAADGEKVGWGVARFAPEANQRAITECANAGGKKCAVQVSRCSRE